MIHPDTELRFISNEIGYGVVATKLIPKGTITWVQDELDQVFTPEKTASIAPLMREYLETYCFINNTGNRILCWDNAKFVNHSFKSSCMSTAYDFEIAIRDIHPGEQLTDDYGYLNVSEPFQAVDEGTPRKIVYPDDLLQFYKTYDEAIQKNLAHIFQVEQPLQQFIESDVWKEFERANKGELKLRSVLTCYYKRDQISV